MMSAGFPRFRRRLLAAIALWVPLVASANPVPWQLNMTEGVSDISKRIYDIHMLVLWICVAIGVTVFAAMVIAMVRFRKSKGAVAETWSHNTKLEVVWTTIPILLLIAMAWPATKLLVDMANVGNANLVVKITGYQWKWRYEYMDYFGKNPDINFISSLAESSNRVRQLGSGIDPHSVKDGDYPDYLLNVDKPLVLPVGVKVRFAITSGDVNHAWWVTTLGWKQDAIPGIVNNQWTEINEPGTYRGQCAELCGRDHAFMPIVVKAVPKAEFEQWMAEQQAERAATKVPATASTMPTALPQG